MAYPSNRLVIFNYSRLQSEAVRLKTNSIVLLKALLYMSKNTKEEHLRVNARVRGIFEGHNFLLNPKGLIDAPQDLAYKLMYLQLTSLRSYTNYKLFKYRHVELDLWPDMELDLVRLNPLVEVIGNHSLVFPLEEAAFTSKKYTCSNEKNIV